MYVYEYVIKLTLQIFKKIVIYSRNFIDRTEAVDPINSRERVNIVGKEREREKRKSCLREAVKEVKMKTREEL